MANKSDKVITKEGKKFLEVTETREVPEERYVDELAMIETDIAMLVTRKKEIEEILNKFK